MSKKLNEKKLISNAVTGETKRCLAILNRTLGKVPTLKLVYKGIIEEIIKENPYIEFYPELLKRIPE